ncbi:hypothetical protein BDQ17DRAFT_1451493 [Cyathus striatus]|nr:hypothetical protein BDQ17DRAFT_1451493 [Cyathus striatus]
MCRLPVKHRRFMAQDYSATVLLAQCNRSSNDGDEVWWWWRWAGMRRHDIGRSWQEMMVVVMVVEGEVVEGEVVEWWWETERHLLPHPLPPPRQPSRTPPQRSPCVLSSTDVVTLGGERRKGKREKEGDGRREEKRREEKRREEKRREKEKGRREGKRKREMGDGRGGVAWACGKSEEGRVEARAEGGGNTLACVAAGWCSAGREEGLDDMTPTPFMPAASSSSDAAAPSVGERLPLRTKGERRGEGEEKEEGGGVDTVLAVVPPSPRCREKGLEGCDVDAVLVSGAVVSFKLKGGVCVVIVTQEGMKGGGTSGG